MVLMCGHATPAPTNNVPSSNNNANQVDEEALAEYRQQRAAARAWRERHNKAKAKALEAALAGGGGGGKGEGEGGEEAAGISWGMGEDAVDEEAEQEAAAAGEDGEGCVVIVDVGGVCVLRGCVSDGCAPPGAAQNPDAQQHHHPRGGKKAKAELPGYLKNLPEHQRRAYDKSKWSGWSEPAPCIARCMSCGGLWVSVT